MPEPRVITKNSQLSDAELCRRNGWTAGTKIVGDEGYGPMVIEITAVGRENILAIECSRGSYENSWSLHDRDWRLYA